MYACPSCGGGLRFDIPSQKLKCDHCETLTDPYSLEERKDAGMDNTFGVTVFTCPQCGGEVMTTDESITGFCMFCGASTVLDARMENHKRPQKIITFKKTKEDCKNIYRRLVGGAIFAPKELKDPDYLEKFRGIYIPYWMYTITYDGPYSISGTTTEASVGYINTNHYKIHCDMDVEYTGISYDASASFDDHVSEAISPFMSAHAQDFTPPMLSGFYADTADVDSSVYREDALKAAQNNLIAGIRSNNTLNKYTMTDLDSSFNSMGKVECENAEAGLGLFPVWFLTYRSSKNRVAYAVVNAESGEISADLPVSIPKYIISSMAVAAAIFALLFFLFTPTPGIALFAAAAFAVISLIVYGAEIHAIKRRHGKYDDKGFYATYGALENQDDIRRYCTASGAVGSILAIIAAIAIAIWQPVDDWIYYAGAIGAIIGVCITMSAIIRRVNILNTRPLPEFHFRKGGDDSAKDL